MNATTMINPGGTRTRMRMFWVATLVAALSTLAVTAWAQPMGGGMGQHGGGHHGRGGDGMMGDSPERMGRMVDRMLDGLNATDAQRSQIRQITQSAAADMKAQHETGRGLRERAMQIFTAPNVDPAAAEALRQQMLAQHDQASKRMMTAMLDISRVLTPEQRAKLAERMKDRAARWKDRAARMHKGERPPR